jgi:hypothetical protein
MRLRQVAQLEPEIELVLEQQKLWEENILQLSDENRHSFEQSDEQLHDLSTVKRLHLHEDMQRVGLLDLVGLMPLMLASDLS